jgi:hypothetical protein
MKGKIETDRAVWYVLLAWIGGALSFYINPAITAIGAGIILVWFIVVIFAITE